MTTMKSYWEGYVRAIEDVLVLSENEKEQATFIRLLYFSQTKLAEEELKNGKV